MKARDYARLACVAGTLSARLALAASEPIEAHTQNPLKTIVLDTTRLTPSEMRAAVGDAVVFENHSVRPVRVTFVAPADAADHVRCGLVRRSAGEPPSAPWLLFVREQGTLTATIPPGRFASVCSLQKGTYDYVVVAADAAPPAASAVVPGAGRIIVQ
jgi:hypothetical protein